MEHKALEMAESRIESILKGAAAETEHVKKRLQEVQKKLDDAQKNKRNAAMVNSSKAYADASMEIANAEMEKEFLNERLAHYQRDPLVSEEDYKRMLDAVYGESGAYEDAEYAAVAELLLSLEQKKDEIIAIEERTDKVLRLLQQKIWRQEVPESFKGRKTEFFERHGEQFTSMWAGNTRRGNYKYPAQLISLLLTSTVPAQEALQFAKQQA